MNQAGDQFLDGLIDYAGIFPPASLPHSVAYDKYCAHVAGDEGWIVESLAWRAADLGLLSDLVGNAEIGVAVIGRPGSDWEGWQLAREQDAKDMSVFLGICPSASVRSYECPLPPTSNLGAGFGSLRSYREQTDVFFEIPFDPDASEALALIAEEEWAFAKFRCGGQVVPSSQQLAEVLKECVDLEVPFKLTAGLHEPVAHGGTHGFLNVFAAVGMRFFEEATVSEMATILSDENPDSFEIGEGLSYRGRAFSADELEDLRSFLLTIGSCSIEEPIAGLNRLVQK